MSEQHTCPRRTGELGPWSREENLDTWRADQTCSFCGSLRGDLFMERIETDTIELGPTDKSYKVYVQNHGGAAFKQTYRDCPEHPCPDVKDSEGRVNVENCRHWVTREVTSTKFYFQHLTVEQQKRFIELMNAQKLRIGMPGHFYRLPFFIQMGK